MCSIRFVFMNIYDTRRNVNCFTLFAIAISLKIYKVRVPAWCDRILFRCNASPRTSNAAKSLLDMTHKQCDRTCLPPIRLSKGINSNPESHMNAKDENENEDNDNALLSLLSYKSIEDLKQSDHRYVSESEGSWDFFF